MHEEKSNDFAEGMLQGLPSVVSYVEEKVNFLQKSIFSPLTEEEKNVLELHRRVFCWIQTLVKLSNKRDFQTVALCTCNLFEITVDLVLLRYNLIEDSVNKMYWWEMSKKLETAEMEQSYFEEMKDSLNQELFEHTLQFVANNKNNVEEQRKNLWPNGCFDRWTGRKLIEDVNEIDRLYKSVLENELGFNFKEFYITQIGKLSWYNSSGLLGIRDVTVKYINSVCAINYKWSADLAMFCTKIVLYYFNFVNHLDSLKNEWGRIRNERIMVYADRLNYIPE